MLCRFPINGFSPEILINLDSTSENILNLLKRGQYVSKMVSAYKKQTVTQESLKKKSLKYSEYLPLSVNLPVTIGILQLHYLQERMEISVVTVDHNIYSFRM
jgi:hypothetical protein